MGRISARFGMHRAKTSYRLPTPRFSWKGSPLGAAAQGGVRMFEIQMGRNPNLRGEPPVQQASAGKKQHGGKGK